MKWTDAEIAAFLAGELAWEMGKTTSDNPYPDGSNLRKQWNDGWIFRSMNIVDIGIDLRKAGNDV